MIEQFLAAAAFCMMIIQFIIASRPGLSCETKEIVTIVSLVAEVAFLAAATAVSSMS